MWTSSVRRTGAPSARLHRHPGGNLQAPADPWARLDDKALKRIAGKSMDGIADFLASAASSPAAVAAKLTPQAVTAGAVTGAAVGAGAKPLGFAASE